MPSPDCRRRAANHERRSGERQVEMRVGEYVLEFGDIGKNDRLAQRLALGMIGKRKPAAERQQDDPAEQRPAGSDQQ